MPLLAAVISDTLYLYPESSSDAVWAALPLVRDAHEAHRPVSLAAELAKVPGWREASQEEMDRFHDWPDEGDGFDIPFPAIETRVTGEELRDNWGKPPPPAYLLKPA